MLDNERGVVHTRYMTSNTLRTLASAAFALIAPACIATPAWVASADTPSDVDLTSVAGIVDQLPSCSEEDCSDQVSQVGIWTNNQGEAYLILGEDFTYHIIDNTAR